MGSVSLSLLVNAWMIVWSAVLVVGHIAHLTPWPGLRTLRSPGATKALVLSSTAAVGGLTLGGVTQYCALVATWAILFASLNWLSSYFGSAE